MGDALGEFRSAGGLLPAMMEYRYGFIPPNYKKSSYLKSVSRLIFTGNIKRVINSKGETVLELSPAGKRELFRKFPIVTLKNRKWDGNFMIVVFDIEEESRKMRNLLREKLKELGFGQMQKSVWISPYHFEDDLKEFMTSNGLDSRVYILKAQTLYVGDIKEFADKVWNLSELNKRYEAILTTIEEEIDKQGVLSKDKISKIWTDYLTILSSDPLLPENFLPPSWIRNNVISKIQKLSRLKNDDRPI